MKLIFKKNGLTEMVKWGGYTYTPPQIIGNWKKHPIQVIKYLWKKRK
jgi:hypothetical protein